MVLLLLLPLAALIILYRLDMISFTGSSRTRIIAVVGAVVLFLAGRALVAIDQTTGTRYASAYEFDSAVSTFGLTTATRLDLQYLLFGNPTASEFDYTDPAEEEPENPSGQENIHEEPEVDPTPVEDPVPIVYGYNTLDIDFAALAESAPNSVIAGAHSYVSSLTPSRQNPYTGLFAGKNLILISAEAFSREVISEEYTPTLYRLYTKGIRFEDYYQPAWGGSTSTGEFSNMTSLIPVHGVSSIRDTAHNNMCCTLGNQLRQLGYFSRAYHPHTYNYYSRDLTHENLGYDQYIGYGNGLEDQITWQWPESDLELMEATVDAYIDQQPFSIYYMTVSGHAGYGWGENAMSYKHRQEVAELDACQGVQGYIACNLELEAAMSYLVARLEAAGIADDTVIVLATDHYPYGLEQSSSTRFGTALGELYGYDWRTPWERDHSALIVWSGCLEDEEPIVVDTPVYSLDIVPTLSNLLGLQYDSRLLVGRDALSDTPPLVLWIDRSWKTDKACYNASTGQYTVFDGYEDQADEAYFAAVNQAISNKFSFSKIVLEQDYYNLLFG
jgi:lipoteichoic acid synthase